MHVMTEHRTNHAHGGWHDAHSQDAPHLAIPLALTGDLVRDCCPSCPRYGFETHESPKAAHETAHSASRAEMNRSRCLARTYSSRHGAGDSSPSSDPRRSIAMSRTTSATNGGGGEAVTELSSTTTAMPM